MEELQRAQEIEDPRYRDGATALDSHVTLVTDIGCYLRSMFWRLKLLSVVLATSGVIHLFCITILYSLLYKDIQ